MRVEVELLKFYSFVFFDSGKLHTDKLSIVEMEIQKKKFTMIAAHCQCQNPVTESPGTGGPNLNVQFPHFYFSL